MDNIAMLAISARSADHVATTNAVASGFQAFNEFIYLFAILVAEEAARFKLPKFPDCRHPFAVTVAKFGSVGGNNQGEQGSSNEGLHGEHPYA